MHRFVTFLIVAILLAATPSFARPPITVQVGAFDFYPGIFRTSDGSIQGFYVDLLSEVAKREGWRLRYIHGDWGNIPRRIGSGEIQLVPGVARREERTSYLDLASVPVLTLWGEVYVPATSPIVTVRQVAGKRVGVMQGCINGLSFRTMVQKLGIPCDIVTFPTYDELFQAVSSGRVDAAVADNVFGGAKQHLYQLKSSGIILPPFNLYFAVAKGKDAEILATLDHYLKEWRATKGSPYYRALDRWGHPGVPLPYTPDWVMRTVIFLLVLSALGGGTAFLLRRQVGRKKKEISVQTREREKIEEALKLKNFTLENIHDAVFWIMPDGRICDANTAAGRLCGCRREDLVNRTFLNCAVLTYKEWEARVKELRGAGNVDFDTTLRASDGKETAVEVSASFFSYQERDYICAIVHDIDERKKEEEILQHRLAVLTGPEADLSSVRLEDLFDREVLQKIQDSFAAATGVAALITDAEGRPVTRPSNFCDLCTIIRGTEKGAANCVRSDATHTCITEGPTLHPCLSGGLWDGGAAIHIDGHLIGKWMVGQVLVDPSEEEKVASYADEIGADREEYLEALAKVPRMPRERFEKISRAVYYIAAQLSTLAVQNVQQGQHIEERRRSEALLMEYRKVIECSSDLICVVDSDYCYSLANSAFLSYWQKSADEVVGHTVQEVVGSGAFSEIKPQMERCMRGEQVTYQRHFHYPSRGKRLMSLSYAPLTGSDGRPLIACVIRDQTEHELLETQLRQAQKMEAIGHLAGGIAHDFNNILTVIIGYGNIMLARSDELDERQKGEVEQIIAASQRAAHLTRGLLAFSRKQVLSPQKVALNDIVNNLQSFLLRIIGEDVQLKFVHHTPHLTVFADRGQIEQVIMNLATNARDAMPEGGMLTVEVTRQEIGVDHVQSHGYGEPGEYACLVVSDTGVGMSKETQERIFEPFFSTKEMGRGTGLGMAIVYGIVKQHKGFINVYSEPGEGTTFRIYLPLLAEDKGDRADEAAPTVPAGGSETILVAEDDATVSKLVETVLKQFGYQVILAVDGNDCVRKFAENSEKVDLILMDMIMPGKSGKEACAEIRELQPAVRVLYSSGYTADFMHGRGDLDPGEDLIMKPVEPMVLLAKVREVLDRDAAVAEAGS